MIYFTLIFSSLIYLMFIVIYSFIFNKFGYFSTPIKLYIYFFICKFIIYLFDCLLIVLWNSWQEKRRWPNAGLLVWVRPTPINSYYIYQSTWFANEWSIAVLAYIVVVKGEASPSIFADWVNGGWFLKPNSKSLGKFG